MKKHINVVAAVMINDDEEILCALRSPSMTLPNLWEFPGGKIELGENHESALKREIKEELNVDIIIGELIESTYYEYDTFTIQLTSYFAKIVSVKLTITEHAELKWVKPAELLKLNWAAADVPAVKKIVHRESLLEVVSS